MDYSEVIIDQRASRENSALHKIMR